MFQVRNYQNMGTDTRDISFYTGRRIREKLSRTFLATVEPDWLTVLQATEQYEKVETGFDHPRGNIPLLPDT